MSLNCMVKVLMGLLDEYADKGETFDLLPYLRRYSLDIMAGKFLYFISKYLLNRIFFNALLIPTKFCIKLELKLNILSYSVMYRIRVSESF